MSDQTAQEPTMEEILASIRRIISEDDAPESEDSKPGDPPEAEASEPAPALTLPEPEPEPESAAAPEPVMLDDDDGDDVLELTERVETVGDLDVYSPTTAPAAEPEASNIGLDEALVGPVAASAAASAFGQLSASVLMGNADLTLEQIVREMLRPMLKDWLDTNLPRIVQATVDAEVERIARGRVR
jgi:cell pole-organizing protein PopZ